MSGKRVDVDEQAKQKREQHQRLFPEYEQFLKDLYRLGMFNGMRDVQITEKEKA